ncbi:MAG: hypothetical protein CMJ57_11335 [Planctomycetaceae bacterium]|nr:hypothetical protein [Planctomycetaceae bacterium]
MVGLLGIVAWLAQLHPARSAPSSYPAAGVPALDPFTAAPAELCLLPGFGPRLARRMHQAIHQRGLTSLEQLPAVRGIGPARLAVLRSACTTWRGR